MSTKIVTRLGILTAILCTGSIARAQNVQSVTPTFTSIGANQSTAVTVMLTAPCGPLGMRVYLDAAPRGVLTVPATLDIAANQNSGVFTVTAPGPFNSDYPIAVQARVHGGAPVSGTVTVTGIKVSDLTMATTALTSGSAYNVTVTISQAPVRNAITLRVPAQAGLRMTDRIVIPVGQTSATFAVQALNVKAQQTSFISVNYDSTAQTTYGITQLVTISP